MPKTIHVNGPCILKARQGSYPPAGQLEEIAISEDGFDIDLTFYDEIIRADTAGTKLGVDLQEMGQDATIRGRMVVFDDDLLDKHFRILGDEEAVGKMPSLGLPIGLSGNATGIVLSSLHDKHWRFFHCRCRGTRQKQSTKYTVVSVEIYSWALIGTANNAKNIPLYDHVDG
jgi:hypothetical protein